MDNTLQVSAVEIPVDLVLASKLIHDEYVANGYYAPIKGGVHHVDHAVYGPATIFVGKRGGALVATMTAYLDSKEWRLPLDELYPNELGDLRGFDKLVEIGAFVAKNLSYLEVGTMITAPYQWAVKQGATKMVCGIPPNRAALYTRGWGFHVVGPVKTTMDNAPVVLMAASTDPKINRSKGCQYANYGNSEVTTI